MMTGPSNRRHAPATLRNRDHILVVLKDILPDTGVVLEIASGSGEHVSYFASLFPTLAWQPTDANPDSLLSIAEWIEGTEGTIREPLCLDVREAEWPVSDVDAIFCANMIHISPWECTVGLMNGAGSLLNDQAVLCLYGPFFRDGVESAPSNVAFDASLRRQDASWGIRHLNDVELQANRNGLSLDKIVELPANNICVVFKKTEEMTAV